MDLVIARFASQAIGIVGGIENCSPLVRLINLACGTVNGLMLIGLDFADTTAETIHLLVDFLDGG